MGSRLCTDVGRPSGCGCFLCAQKLKVTGARRSTESRSAFLLRFLLSTHGGSRCLRLSGHYAGCSMPYMPQSGLVSRDPSYMSPFDLGVCCDWHHAPLLCSTLGVRDGCLRGPSKPSTSISWKRSLRIHPLPRSVCKGKSLRPRGEPTLFSLICLRRSETEQGSPRIGAQHHRGLETWQGCPGS